ncbi:hypothetical protein BJ322DRAFT_976679, partial [Thelephora terrestris]
GKMAVTGAKPGDSSRLASRKYACIDQKLGFDTKFLEFTTRRIVGGHGVKFPIRSEGLVYNHGHFIIYGP